MTSTRVTNFFSHIIVFTAALQAFQLGSMLNYFFPSYKQMSMPSRTVEALPSSIREQYRAFGEVDHKLHELHQFEETVRYIRDHNK